MTREARTPPQRRVEPTSTRETPPPGLLIGLEIHQQLDTDKLFCRCPSILDDGAGVHVLRYLRPTQSEMGEVDRAALEEAKKHLAFEYIAPASSSCLVELDEEPPHEVSSPALQAGLDLSALLASQPVDELQIMRKIVIDGSNTTGFQRTALLGLGGRVETSRGPVAVQTICLEEDSARRVGRSGGLVTFRLDRLGIPLIEIATAPTIQDGEHARETAEEIGLALRRTGSAKRGIGTIRQDVNISIPGGARVELKGVQELRLLPAAVDAEVRRQQMLIAVTDELKKRGAHTKDLEKRPLEVTATLSGSQSKVITEALAKGGVVYGLALPKFASLLGKKDSGGFRLGAELSQRAKARAGVAGIFHSDELPGHGITETEVGAVRGALSLADGDAFALVAAEKPRAVAALEAARDRALQALAGVPEETREVRPDGASIYLRPLPGRARMYPETDIPPRTITPADMEAARLRLDERAKRVGRLEAEARAVLAPGDFVQLKAVDALEEFAAIATVTAKMGVDTKAAAPHVARVLLHVVPEIEAKEPDMPPPSRLAIAESVAGTVTGRFAKEALTEVLAEIRRTGCSLDEAVKRLGLVNVSEAEVRRVVEGVVVKGSALITSRGAGAQAPLMGDVMKELRGRADGGLVSRLLSEEIRKRLKR